MKHLIMSLVCGAVLISGSSVLAGQSCCPTKTSTSKKTVQTTCPVMGGKINKDLYVDVKGKRIYICCKGCIKTIEENPDKYIKKLEDAGVKIEKIPASKKKK